MENNDHSCHIGTAHHSDEFKKAMQNRLNRIIGQIKGVNRMIQEDIYCDDILNQITAVQSALMAAGEMLLEAHLKSCIVEQIQKGDVEKIDELMKTIKKMIR